MNRVTHLSTGLSTVAKRFKKVHVEITNICNLQCNFCPEVDRTKKFMSIEEFDRTIAQVAPLADEVALHLMGEPLGHPHLKEILECCIRHRVPVNFTTNGTLLTDANSELLLSPVVRQVNFSVHSFEANFPSQAADAYLKKIIRFTHRAFLERPDLYINYRIWDLNDAISLTEMNQKIRAAIESEFQFSVADFKIDLRRKKGYRIKNRLYLNFDSRFVWPSLNLPIRSAEGFCHGLSNHIGIHSDGTVVPCCLDKEADLALGNLAQQSLEQILESPRATQIREGFKAGQCVESLCQRCDFIKRFDAKKL